MKCLGRVTIQKYVDYEISEFELKGIRNHISQCAKCKKLLSEVTEDGKLAKRSLDRLNPEVTGSVEFSVASKRTGTTKREPFYKRFISSSLRIPIPLVIAISVLFVYLAVSVITTHAGNSQMPIRSQDKKKGATLYLSGIDSIQAIDLKTDLSNYTLVESPNVFILKEKNHEELLP
jgi:hypothetical protein